MARHGKKYRTNREKVDRAKRYKVDEALALIKQMATAKFDESVDVAINLGVNPKYSDQMVRGAVPMPHGVGKTVRIAVFAKGDKAKEAEAAGADIIGAEDLGEKVRAGFLDFDAAIATPDMMKVVGGLGKVLGPRGLMPNPKTGTVTMDVTKAIKELKAGKIEFRVEKEGIIHCPIGKASFEQQKLKENLTALIDAITKAKPPAAKGQYYRAATIASTMGPGIKLDLTDLTGLAG
jgi:large subunit ribosomal protein L1